MAMSVDALPEFPVSSLLPRKETGILSFLNKYPKYDGTGIVIAVFDSGVDPAANGLQVCTNGSVKVLDRLDASGAGDVDTSTVVRASRFGTVTGNTGRILKIPSNWNNPTGEYYLGVKSAYSLYPGKLKDRLVKERKEQIIEPHFKQIQEAAMRRLQQEKQRNSSISGSGANPSPTEDNDTNVCEGSNSNNNAAAGVGTGDESNSGCCTDDAADSDTASRGGTAAGGTNNGCQSSNPGTQGESLYDFTSFLDKQQKDECDAEVALLHILHKKYQDLGPVYDCVVYHDGKCWRACLDTSECGELSEGVNLGEYRVTHEWAPLTSKDSFTVTVNVHNNGHLLEVVGMCSSHGTHVASIASAHFPDDPERNGVAPGAQIVSITIGDNRVYGMETGTALSRAMSWVMDNPHYKVDVINMSYGEHSHTSLSGRLGELACDVVNKYGVLWIASASNHGPALSTVGSPPDFYSDCIMGIGAYISPDMMRAEYSIMDKLPGTAYTWSSRGPTSDGGRGVSVCAPGGAITSMPAFTNKTSQLLNGTSMASPHAAGCCALLLSGLQQQRRHYTPYTVRRALQNTAQRLEIDPFVQGHGLLQVEKAFDYLSQFGVLSESSSLSPPEDSMRFVLECGGKGLKGIYLRNWLGNKSVDTNVTVEPIQFDEARADDRVKRSLNLDLVLTCDEPYVSCPDCLHMSYTPRTFMVRVNPQSLVRGRVYSTSVKAFVAGAPERGPLFEVPVTVVMPIVDLEHGYLYKGTPEVYRAGCVRRTFLRVPEGATWAQFSIKSSNSDQNQRITLHAVQLFPQCSVLTYDHYKTFSCLYPNETSSTTFSVYSGLTVELCVARWWAALHDTSIEYSLSFHGIKPSSESLTIYSNYSIQRMDVTAKLRAEDLWVQATLKHHVQSLAPYDSRIEVLGGQRDTVPINRPIYQLVLSYSFTLPKSGDVQPKCGLLNEYLYESAVESQLWMVFDHKKQHVGSGDAYSQKYSIKLDKGDYVIRLHIRHEKTELLEKLQEIPMSVITKLQQEVKLDPYMNYHNALVGNKKLTIAVMQPGDITPIFFAMPNLQDKSFKSLGLVPGHILSGSVSFARDEQARKADTYPLRVVVTEPVGSKKRAPNFVNEGENQRKEPRTYQEYSDAVRDLRINWITKLDYESSDELYQDVCRNTGNFLQAHVARLHTVDAHFNMPPFGANFNCTYTVPEAAAAAATASPAPSTSSTDATASSADTSSSSTATTVVEVNVASGGSPDSASADNTNGDSAVVESDSSTAAAGAAAAAAVNTSTSLDATSSSSQGGGATSSSKETWLQWKNSCNDVSRKVEKSIDFSALLAYLGTKMDIRADAAKFKTKMDRQKQALIDAYCKHGTAIAHPYVPPLINPNLPRPPADAPSTYTDVIVPMMPPDSVLNELDTIATTVLKLVDTCDVKVTGFFVSYYQVRRLYASAARLLYRHLEERGTKESYLRMATLYRLLGYHQLVRDIFRGLPLRFPEKYVPF